jgi:NodT family efflux transporter outer membrane factor (OMF) lipoprotein
MNAMTSLANTAPPQAARLAALCAALVLAGCASLGGAASKDAGRRPDPSVIPSALPSPAAGATASAALASDWPTLVQSPQARELVRLALAHNRDLQVAALNVDKARAQLRVGEADRWPTVNAVLGGTRSPNNSGGLSNSFTAGLSLTAYEADLWGRVKSANAATAAQLGATLANRRAAELTVVTAVVAAHLSLVADDELLALSQRTLSTRLDTLKLTTLRAKVGAVADPELRATQALVAQSRAALAQQERQRQLDENALALLIGEAVPAALLPVRAAATTNSTATSSALLNQAWLSELQPAAKSDVLLQRPDVIAAEQQLAAADASVSAARAALFPRIALSTSGGLASSDLSTLLNAGSLAWTLGAQATMAIFDSGRNQANIEVAKVSRDIAVASYEKALQTAFKEAADGIAGLNTWTVQLGALRDQLSAERDRDRLTRLRYDSGAASALDLLDSQRSLYATEQAVIQTRLAELQNRLALYKALGGWPAEAGDGKTAAR